MDNLPAHKVPVRAAIEAVGANLVYLYPYSPDFNPIENCWSKVKQFLRSSAARTYCELDDAITKALLLSRIKTLLDGLLTAVTIFHPTENFYRSILTIISRA